MSKVRHFDTIFVELRSITYRHRCHNTPAVDPVDVREAKNLTCPLGCGAHWCKQCNQTFEVGGIHSCDGQAEMDHLLGQKNWKKCPGLCLSSSNDDPPLLTLLQLAKCLSRKVRDDSSTLFNSLLNCSIVQGCNHMTCRCNWCGLLLFRPLLPSDLWRTSNSHFCYICGGEITRSVNRRDIEREVQAHYRKDCKLFEYTE